MKRTKRICKGVIYGFIITCLSILVMPSCTQKNLIPEGKAIYVPHEFDSIGFDNPECRYSYHRMACTEDVAVFWEAGFGDDLSKAPDLNGKSMTVDLKKILDQSERFYKYYRDTLKFIKPGSKADKYRMMIMINYSEEGTAYGGSYDDSIGALWVTPQRLQGERLNAVAHELGHSFQAQTVIDNTPGGMGGGGLHEMTSQWMLWQVNPLWMKDENYHWVDYMKQTHLSFMHYQNMYHSPYLLEYWSDKHGAEIIADIWNKGKRGEDPVTCYQRLTNINQEQFNAEIFEAAQKFITYDFDRVREVAKPYANKHNSQVIAANNDGWFAIAPERCLQNYGYNGIQLNVPEPGTTVTLQFQGIPNKDGVEGGWRYGFLAVQKDGKPIYGEMGTNANGTLAYQVPQDGLSFLWLVVSSAPAQHSLDPKISWPYKVKLEGTGFAPEAIIGSKKSQ